MAAKTFKPRPGYKMVPGYPYAIPQGIDPANLSADQIFEAEVKLEECRSRLLSVKEHEWYGQVTVQMRWKPRRDLSAKTMGVSIDREGTVTCWFDPVFVLSRSEDALCSCIIHEVEHILRQHLHRIENRDPRAWNRVADMSINGRKERPHRDDPGIWFRRNSDDEYSLPLRPDIDGHDIVWLPDDIDPEMATEQIYDIFYPKMEDCDDCDDQDQDEQDQDEQDQDEQDQDEQDQDEQDQDEQDQDEQDGDGSEDQDEQGDDEEGEGGSGDSDEADDGDEGDEDEGQGNGQGQDEGSDEGDEGQGNGQGQDEGSDEGDEGQGNGQGGGQGQGSGSGQGQQEDSCGSCNGVGSVFPGSDGVVFDDHDVWDESTASPEEARQIIKGMTDFATKIAGEGPGHLKAALERLGVPIVDWRNAFRNIFGRHIGKKRKSYQRFHRRRHAFGIPGQTRRGAGKALVICDVSGSVSEGEWEQFWAEIDRQMARVIEVAILQWDDKGDNMTRDEFREIYWPSYRMGDWKRIERVGFGGTRMDKAVAFAAKNGLVADRDVVVILTDGETPWIQEDIGVPIINVITQSEANAHRFMRKRPPEWQETIYMAAF